MRQILTDCPLWVKYLLNLVKFFHPTPVKLLEHFQVRQKTDNPFFDELFEYSHFFVISSFEPMLAKKNKTGEWRRGWWPKSSKYFPRCLFDENHLIFLYPAAALSCPTLFFKGRPKKYLDTNKNKKSQAVILQQFNHVLHLSGYI